MTNRSGSITGEEIAHINTIVEVLEDNLPTATKMLVGGVPLWDSNGDLLGVVRIDTEGAVEFYPNGELDSLE